MKDKIKCGKKFFEDNYPEYFSDSYIPMFNEFKKLRDETLKELRHKFLTDRRIATLNNEIAALYNIAIPKAVVKKDGVAVLIYDDKTEHEVKRIRNLIIDIVESDYKELVRR